MIAVVGGGVVGPQAIRPLAAAVMRHYGYTVPDDLLTQAELRELEPTLSPRAEMGYVMLGITLAPANDSGYGLSGSTWTRDVGNSVRTRSTRSPRPTPCSSRLRSERGHMGNLGNRLQDRVAVVTGGGSGIGLASARRMAAEGAKVVIGDLDPGTGKAAADEVGGLFVPADVTSEADVENLFWAAFDTYGSVDITFNNAGISPPDDDSILVTSCSAGCPRSLRVLPG